MVDHQEHFGRLFYKDLKTGYWISTDYPRIRAHQWVWINIHGKIPKGLHIHHKDENKSNNSIDNLSILDPSQHQALHYKLNPLKREKARKWINEIRPLASKWHGSEEGIAWHKYHAAKERFGKWKPTKYICQQCSKEYKSTKRSRCRFCSNNCKSEWRRKSGIDDIYKMCPSCEKEFKSNKYEKITFCSRKCAQKRPLI